MADHPLLRPQVLAGACTSFERSMSGLPENLFSDLFRAGGVMNVEGGEAIFDEIVMSRRTAGITGPADRYPTGALTGRIPRKFTMFHLKEHRFIPWDRLFYERAGGQLLPNAAAQIAIEQRDALQVLQVTWERICAAMMHGSVDTSTFENSTVSVTVTVTGINTYTYSTDWSGASAKIRSSEINLLKTDYRASAEEEPGLVVCNSTVENYILANTELQSFTTEFMGREFVEADYVEKLRLGKMEWIVDEAGYTPTGGSRTKFVSDKKALVLPPRQKLGGALRLFLGYGSIPEGAYGSGTLRRAPTPGLYSFAQPSNILITGEGVDLFTGFVGFPAIVCPRKVQVATLAA